MVGRLIRIERRQLEAGLLSAVGISGRGKKVTRYVARNDGGVDYKRRESGHKVPLHALRHTAVMHEPSSVCMRVHRAFVLVMDIPPPLLPLLLR